MPLEGHFLLVVIPKSFMLTHEGHATPVPHSVGEDARCLLLHGTQEQY